MTKKRARSSNHKEDESQQIKKMKTVESIDKTTKPVDEAAEDQTREQISLPQRELNPPQELSQCIKQIDLTHSTDDTTTDDD